MPTEPPTLPGPWDSLIPGRPLPKGGGTEFKHGLGAHT